jgi:hypothetical protein
MFNSVEAAVQTLEDSQALAYTISQVPNLKLTGEADTPQNLIDKFLVDWEKLAPGIYKVDYSKNLADKRTGLCFRVSKTAPAAGSPAQLAGIGGPNDMVSGLQQQIWNLQKDAEMRAMQQQHNEELRRLKEKDGDGDLLGPLIGVLPRIENMIYMATGRPPLTQAVAAVAGPSLPPAEGAGLNDDGAKVAAALEQLQEGLGHELLVEVLQKLASKEPIKLRQLASMIDML